jgi:TPR repeat protein
VLRLLGPALVTAFVIASAFGCHADRRSDVYSSAYRDCTHGDADACFEHGQSREVGTAEQRRSALVAYQYACFLDHAPSCGRLAFFWGEADLTDRTTVDNLRTACDGGDGRSCTELADRLPDRMALGLYERACAAEHAAGCEGKAEILRKQFRLPDKLEAAHELSTRACDMGHPPACISAGQALLFGSGVAQDTERGLTLLERACSKEEGASCMVLARIWQDGLGVSPDANKADVYYALAETHVDDPVASDPTSAFVVYVNACNFGDLLGCFNAAWYLAEGAQVRRNISTSRELFERACNGGIARACERWKKIQPRQRVRRSEVR